MEAKAGKRERWARRMKTADKVFLNMIPDSRPILGEERQCESLLVS